MTISNQHTEDIGDVISTIAELLKIAVPSTFELEKNAYDGIRNNNGLFTSSHLVILLILSLIHNI